MTSKVAFAIVTRVSAASIVGTVDANRVCRLVAAGRRRVLYSRPLVHSESRAKRLLEGNPPLYVVLLLIAIPPQGLWFLDSLDLAEKLGFEAVVVAVAAMVVAIQHVEHLETVADELRGLADKLAGQANDVRVLAESVPTRGIGLFPRYLSDVAGLVTRAEDSIRILCDTPAHGAFSNTVAFTKYWQTLRHKMVDPGVTIECTFLDAAGREQMHRAQIAADAGRWEDWKELNRENCEAFDKLARELKVMPPAAPDRQDSLSVWAATPDAYVASVMALNDAVWERFDESVTVEWLSFADPLHEGPSVYFWLRDHDQEAVFVIVPVRGIGVKHLVGFHTTEKELIRALDTVFAHRKEGR